MRSIAAIGVGLFAEVVAVFAFYGVAVGELLGLDMPGWLLAVLFFSTLPVIGMASTFLAARSAAVGALRLGVGVASFAIFSSFVYLAALYFFAFEG